MTAQIRLLSVEPIPADDLLGALRRTPLRGYEGVLPYAAASIELRRVAPDDLAPAQNYVLRDGVDRVLVLRSALLAHGIDLFDLAGGAWIRTQDHPDEPIPVLPPIVEESIEPDGRTVDLISDGLHRVFAARSVGAQITVVYVRGVPSEYPYYAYAEPDGWAAVQLLDELVEGHQKKRYRQPESYKALFRDYNALFPGVQKQRTQTNPAHLRA